VLSQFASQAQPSSRFADRLEPEAIAAPLGDEPGAARVIDLLLRVGAWGDGFGLEPDGLTLRKLAAHEHGLDLGPLESRLPGRRQAPSGRIPLAPAASSKICRGSKPRSATNDLC